MQRQPLQQLQSLLHQVKPEQYAKTRNHINGDNTKLAPFITHGMVHIADIIRGYNNDINSNNGHNNKVSVLNLEHKLVQQFAWRGFFQHVWDHLGNYILTPLDKPIRQFPQLKPGEPMAHLWTQAISDDVLQANTGIPLIDESIIDLYETGYLHNHQRMWLMSYLLHWKKVNWNTAANWLYGYLLDGDLASNHLSTQWIGGSFSKKPYIFNAESAAKFTPKAYHSFKTILDISYEDALDQAFSTKPMNAGSSKANPKNKIAKFASINEVPKLLATPHQAIEWMNANTPLKPLKILRLSELNDNELLKIKQNCYGMHPWNLKGNDTPTIAFLDATFHEKYPWSLKRWCFVLEEMQKYTENGIVLWIETPQDWKQLSQDTNIHTLHNNHYQNLKLLPKNRVIRVCDVDVYSWKQPTQFFVSFSQYYKNICLINDVKTVDFSHRS